MPQVQEAQPQAQVDADADSEERAIPTAGIRASPAASADGYACDEPAGDGERVEISGPFVLFIMDHRSSSANPAPTGSTSAGCWSGTGTGTTGSCAASGLGTLHRATSTSAALSWLSSTVERAVQRLAPATGTSQPDAAYSHKRRPTSGNGPERDPAAGTSEPPPASADLEPEPRSSTPSSPGLDAQRPFVPAAHERRAAVAETHERPAAAAAAPDVQRRRVHAHVPPPGAAPAARPDQRGAAAAPARAAVHADLPARAAAAALAVHDAAWEPADAGHAHVAARAE